MANIDTKIIEDKETNDIKATDIDEKDRNEEQADWTDNAKKMKRSEKSVKRYQWFILKVAIVLFIFWILFWKVIGLTNMPNTYMSPNIEAGDLLLYYRLDDHMKNQDVIVYNAIDNGNKEMLVGRIVAGPTDVVEISDEGHLIVNGNAVTESKASGATYKYEDKVEYPLKLEADEYFVLGDARVQSLDSRYYGVVKKSDIIGTVINLMRRQNI